MNSSTSQAAMPGRTVPYVLQPGEGRCFNVANQLIRILAGGPETAGGFGAIVCDATYDRQPIPLHYHDREHDVWFCTRGRVQVWFGDHSRILTAGDFCYAPAMAVHAYQSVAPRSQFFGVVAPGGWEQFFEDSGEVWTEQGLPPANRPFDFARLGQSMGKYRVRRAEGAYADSVNGDATDRALPNRESAYVLQAGYGAKAQLNGHLSIRLITPQISANHFDMRTIEGAREAQMPMIAHARTHVFLYLIEGVVRLTLGETEHVLSTGSAANIPAGTPYGTLVQSAGARWLLTSSGGEGLSFWDELGTATDAFAFGQADNSGALNAALQAHAHGDVAPV